MTDLGIEFRNDIARLLNPWYVAIDLLVQIMEHTLTVCWDSVPLRLRDR